MPWHGRENVYVLLVRLCHNLHFVSSFHPIKTRLKFTLPRKETPWTPTTLLHPPPQPPQPLLGLLQHLILLAHREPQPILCHQLILLRVEIRGWDGGHAQLHDQEPAEFEIPGAFGDVGREIVVVGHVDAGEVGEDEVAAFGFGVLIDRSPR